MTKVKIVTHGFGKEKGMGLMSMLLTERYECFLSQNNGAQDSFECPADKYESTGGDAGDF